jgi:hypothetical protein
MANPETQHLALERIAYVVSIMAKQTESALHILERDHRGNCGGKQVSKPESDTDL